MVTPGVHTIEGVRSTWHVLMSLRAGATPESTPDRTVREVCSPESQHEHRVHVAWAIHSQAPHALLVAA